jgi:hypothetical protein
LGHIISKEGIPVDPEKIRVVEGWTTLRNVSKARSFMGLAGYYKRFIEGFSKIVKDSQRYRTQSLPCKRQV